MKIRLKTVNYIFFAAIAISFCLILIGAIVEILPLAGIGFLLTLASVIFRLVFCVCPYCGNSLFRHTLDQGFCPYCGEDLK